MSNLRKVLRLKDGSEATVNGIVYTRLDNIDGEKEWKVSPKGLEGDFDTGCYWLNSEELTDELSDE